MNKNECDQNELKRKGFKDKITRVGHSESLSLATIATHYKVKKGTKKTCKT